MELTKTELSALAMIHRDLVGTYAGYLADVTMRNPRRSVMLSNMCEAQTTQPNNILIASLLAGG